MTKCHFRLLAALLLGLSSLPLAWGSSIGVRYPAGSIVDSEQAEAALRAVDAERARLEHEFAVREAECYKRFLVNRCRERVRADREAADRELRRVRLEARDTQRRLEAEELARRRAAEQAKAAEREAEAVPAPARSPRPASEPRPGGTRDVPKSSARTPEEEAAATQSRADAEARHRERLAEAARRAAESGEHVRQYELRQSEAAKAAAAKDEERRNNEQKRAERRRKLAEAEARREEIRKRAAEAARTAGK